MGSKNSSLSLRSKRQDNGVFESISQGKHGANAPQVGRMEEVADFFHGSRGNHETKYGGRYSHGKRLSDEEISEG